MNAVTTVEDKSLPPKTGALTAGGAVRSVVPQTLEDVYRLSSLIIKSGLAPKDFKTSEACTVAILHGMEIGLKPMQALQRIAVINGRPTLWGDAMLGLVEASGLLEDIDESFEGNEDDFRAVCVIKRRGRPTRVICTFSISDSKRAGLFGKAGPHTQYRDRMLKMRARSFALRDAFPDVLGGMSSAEEAMDMDPPEIKDITPKRPELSDFTKTSQKPAETVNADTGEITTESEGPAADEDEATTYGNADAYKDGQTAFKEGVPREKAPAHLAQLGFAEPWQAGWDDAQAEYDASLEAKTAKASTGKLV